VGHFGSAGVPVVPEAKRSLYSPQVLSHLVDMGLDKTIKEESNPALRPQRTHRHRHAAVRTNATFAACVASVTNADTFYHQLVLSLPHSKNKRIVIGREQRDKQTEKNVLGSTFHVPPDFNFELSFSVESYWSALPTWVCL
jgi:hypothetical protein